MNAESASTEGFVGCIASIAALLASFIPPEEGLRITCLLLSMLASVATIIKAGKTK